MTFTLSSIDVTPPLYLSAEVAILSACETSQGIYQTGEGVMSIARAFVYAGCGSVLTSLWRLHDETASELMAGWHGYAKEGTTLDVALHQSKLDYLEEADAIAGHPGRWAGMVWVGAKYDLISTNPSWYWWIGGMIVVILIFMLFQFWENSRIRLS